MRRPARTGVPGSRVPLPGSTDQSSQLPELSTCVVPKMVTTSRSQESRREGHGLTFLLEEWKCEPHVGREDMKRHQKKITSHALISPPMSSQELTSHAPPTHRKGVANRDQGEETYFRFWLLCWATGRATLLPEMSSNNRRDADMEK